MTEPDRAAAAARRTLKSLSRPSGSFDASRYFRGDQDLGFYNVGTTVVRQMARTIAAVYRDRWSVVDAVAFADALIVDKHLEAKSLGIEVLARYRRAFTPRLLAVWKRWLAGNHSANWATTDAICGALIGPLLVTHPALVHEMPAWSRHKNMWVRRASVVGLIPSARKGIALDVAYANAFRLHSDREDLIQKAVGWTLREAGKADSARLEQYLLENGPRIPRTTLRYAIERFPISKRTAILLATKTRKHEK